MEVELTMPEAEFFAENQPITIIPNFRQDTLDLLCGNYGPFRPALPLDVPI